MTKAKKARVIVASAVANPKGRTATAAAKKPSKVKIKVANNAQHGKLSGVFQDLSTQHEALDTSTGEIADLIMDIENQVNNGQFTADAAKTLASDLKAAQKMMKDVLKASTTLTKALTKIQSSAQKGQVAPDNVIDLTIPKSAKSLTSMSNDDKYDAIVGDEDDERSFVNSQAIMTVEYAEITADGSLRMHPMEGSEPDDAGKTQKTLQALFDAWCKAYKAKSTNAKTGGKGMEPWAVEMAAIVKKTITKVDTGISGMGSSDGAWVRDVEGAKIRKALKSAGFKVKQHEGAPDGGWLIFSKESPKKGIYDMVSDEEENMEILSWFNEETKK